MPRGMEPVSKTSELNLREDGTSTYTQYHMFCMGLSRGNAYTGMLNETVGRYSEIPLMYSSHPSEKGKGVSMADRRKIEELV